MEILIIALLCLPVLVATFLFLFRYPVYSFTMAWFLTFLPVEYLDRYFVKLPTAVKWGPQVFIILLAVVSLAKFKTKPLRVPTAFWLLYVLFLVAGLISGLYNPSQIGEIIFAQRGFIFLFAYLLVFRLVYHKHSVDDILRMTVQTGAVSSVVAILQRVYVTLTGRTGDMITGIFYVDSQYLFFQGICFAIVMAFWFHGKPLLRWLSGQQLALLFVLSVGVANNKAGIAFLAVVALMFGGFIGLKAFWRFFGRLIVIGGFMSLGLIIFDAIIKTKVKSVAREDGSFVYLTDPEYIQNYLFGTGTDPWNDMFGKAGELKRGSAVTFGFGLISRDPMLLFFGKGPGSTSASSLRATEGYLSKRYPTYKIGRSLLSEKLTENGLLGVGLILGMILVVFFYNPSTGANRYDHVQLLLKKVTALFLIVYMPYENMSQLLIFGFVFAVLLYPPSIQPVPQSIVEPDQTEPNHARASSYSHP